MADKKNQVTPDQTKTTKIRAPEAEKDIYENFEDKVSKAMTKVGKTLGKVKDRVWGSGNVSEFESNRDTYIKNRQK